MQAAWGPTPRPPRPVPANMLTELPEHPPRRHETTTKEIPALLILYRNAISIFLSASIVSEWRTKERKNSPQREMSQGRRPQPRARPRTPPNVAIWPLLVLLLLCTTYLRTTQAVACIWANFLCKHFTLQSRGCAPRAPD